MPCTAAVSVNDMHKLRLFYANAKAANNTWWADEIINGLKI